MVRVKLTDEERKLRRKASQAKWDKEKRAAYRKANRDRERATRAKWWTENRERKAAYRASYRAANPDKIRASSASYYKQNATRLKACNAARYKINAAKIKARNSAWRAANPEKDKACSLAWRRANPEKVAATNAKLSAKRRSIKLSAMPGWANQFFIAEIYDLAKRRTAATGYAWHVDHIVPLQSRRVCGLHVEHNLQVIPGTRNIAKGNRDWPDMPGVTSIG